MFFLYVGIWFYIIWYSLVLLIERWFCINVLNNLRQIIFDICESIVCCGGQYSWRIMIKVDQRWEILGDGVEFIWKFDYIVFYFIQLNVIYLFL